jgi:Fe-S cluster assembly ATP-binding protein
MIINILEIKNLYVSINDILILENLNLLINSGEIHAIMGKNGSGKSTLSKVIAGHPSYKILSGDILFKGKSILNHTPEERSHLGIFLAFQYPIEISGVSNVDFLYNAYNSHNLNKKFKEIDPINFIILLNTIIKNLEVINEHFKSFLNRNVNEGFSGGEKKCNEILQMILLDCDLSILDETDSGLDIDALKLVSNGINTFKNKNNSIILITHYQRLLNFVKPNFVHIMNKGTIIKTNDINLVLQLEKYGYESCL